MKRTILLYTLLFFLILFTTNLASAAHFIVGFVNDSHDGAPANGKTIVVWNPANGILDNITDTIGPTGNSGTNNLFLVDCELLSTPCAIGDTMRSRVVNSGDNNITQNKSVIVTGAGFDTMPNNRINTEANVNLTSPVDNYNSTGYIEFSCTYDDPDNESGEIQLWGNWTGSWHLNETLSVSNDGDIATFNKTLTQASYEWACFAQDNLSLGMFSAENRTFNIDTTDPAVSNVVTNESISCNALTVRINCTATDTPLDIHTVIIQTIAPNASTTNITASLLEGDTYFVDSYLDSQGVWTFNCIANDTAGNSNNQTGGSFELLSGVDIELSSDDIFFNITPTIETQVVNVTAHVTNQGCNLTNNFVVGFYNGDKDAGGVSLQNNTISIAGNASLNTSIAWPAEIGLSNIFVYADLDTAVTESNESNNIGNKTSYLTAWQEIFGNTTLARRLSTATALGNLTDWLNQTGFDGNIFITDSEADINWYSLQAIGRNESGQITSNDFTEIDTALSMSTLNDSVYNTFTNSGTPIETRTFNLFNYSVANVSSINSTNNANFKTGILWDTSDDSGNEEFDTTDNEDLIFAVEVNKSQIGKYQVSDYEIRIPVRLRQYDATDTSEVYYYYELE